MTHRTTCPTALLLALALTACAQPTPAAVTPAAPPRPTPRSAAQPGPPAPDPPPAILIKLTPADEVLHPDLERWVTHGRVQVEAWFGEPFPESLTVFVHPDRAAFTASFPAEWGLAQTQCWMVAYGVADRLSLLSPRAWPGEACEHDAGNDVHVQRIVTHELVHAFHGQHNLTRDFTGIEEATGWFAEGLAVLVSGQLDDERLASARRAVAIGHGPVALTTAWSGQDRYGVCGSLVAFLEARVGRDGLRQLLAATDLEAFLDAAALSEQEWLEAWRAEMLAGEVD